MRLLTRPVGVGTTVDVLPVAQRSVGRRLATALSAPSSTTPTTPRTPTA